jgi:hypothetical protein
MVHNLRAEPKLTLRRGRHREALIAREVPLEAASSVLKRYVAQVPITRPYFDADASATEREFAAEAGSHPVFELDAAH